MCLAPRYMKGIGSGPRVAATKAASVPPMLWAWAAPAIARAVRPAGHPQRESFPIAPGIPWFRAPGQPAPEVSELLAHRRAHRARRVGQEAVAGAQAALAVD